MIEQIALTAPEWLRFVEGQADCTPFHHPAWASVIAGVYGFEACAHVQRDRAGAIVAGLPAVRVPSLGRGTRWRCLPFTDHCGPLGSPDERDALTTALGARRTERWQVREATPSLGTGEAVAVIHRLDLAPGPDALFNAFHKSQVQRAIKKAEREGCVDIREATRESDLTETYYSLHVATRKRQGVPPQPRRLFAAIWRDLHMRGLAWTLLAEIDAEPVAGAVFLAWKETVIYKYGASLADRRQARPNHLIFWNAIQRACAQGHRELDFGRTDFDNEGLRAFKRNWGAREETLVYSATASSRAEGVRRIPEPPPAGHDPSGGRLETLMSSVIRRSPPRVCELIGTALYRFAA